MNTPLKVWIVLSPEEAVDVVSTQLKTHSVGVECQTYCKIRAEITSEANNQSLLDEVEYSLTLLKDY